MNNTPFDLIAAPHTPFDAAGELDLGPVARQAEHLRSFGVTGVLVAGSTGEGPSLSTEERRRLAARWVEVGGSLQVMIHVGHNSVKEAAGLARHAAELGASAICAAPPSWFPIDTAKVLADTCAAIAAGAPELPFFYYHIPALSGVNVSMAALLDLVREVAPSFAGVKYTHPDALDFGTCVQEHGADMRMWWGVDEALVTGLAAGAHGAVGSSYNFAAPIYLRLIAAWRAGDLDTANVLQQRSILLIETLAARGYLPAAKMVMRIFGVECGPTRLPQPRLEPSAEAALRADLERIGYFGWIEG